MGRAMLIAAGPGRAMLIGAGPGKIHLMQTKLMVYLCISSLLRFQLTTLLLSYDPKTRPSTCANMHVHTHTHTQTRMHTQTHEHEEYLLFGRQTVVVIRAEATTINVCKHARAHLPPYIRTPANTPTHEYTECCLDDPLFCLFHCCLQSSSLWNCNKTTYACLRVRLLKSIEECVVASPVASAILATTTPEDAAEYISKRPPALSSNGICTRNDSAT